MAEAGRRGRARPTDLGARGDPYLPQQPQDGHLQASAQQLHPQQEASMDRIEVMLSIFLCSFVCLLGSLAAPP
ncbi:MAG: hypothetical protein MH204_00170 [Fimbriimonadaceae bacterium]|nr:hypothetical protein [Fimbriimonadaceae bacterium]